ncbi:MAG: CDP-diacylglycerol--glycerol-3-phosphate 3-phosphatidyltransferase [Clostridia bacterium]|nr:CDP-diacylglycerol--glycerol-3-phosphate 3-phosphatidyltransferase [Clostridia bacterium]
MNLPNKLTVLRMIMVPIFVVVMMVSDAIWADIVGVVLFIAASLTDMLDGKIARKHNLVTDFGKFMDPLADKFMVIGAMMVILYKNLTAAEPNRVFGILFFCALLIVIFRELAVTAMRLVVSGSSGIVVAANMLGKIKTCTQIACVVLCIVEPIVYSSVDALSSWKAYLPLSVISTAAMAFFTLLSGVNYIKSYWKYMDPEK